MDELVERVRQALAAEYTGAGDGRIRDVPDRRAIRWYTTIGLVDRPLGMRGRTALYGPRHLQQLVAIKRRQAAGRSLSQIQGELNWLSDEALAELSDVPETLLEAHGPAPDDVANDRHMRFWARQPAPSPPATAEVAPASSTAQPASAQPASAQPASAQPASAQLAAQASSAQATSAQATSAQATPARLGAGQPASGQPVSGQPAPGWPAPGQPSTPLTSARLTSAEATSGRPMSDQHPSASGQDTAGQATRGQSGEASAASRQPGLPKPVHGVALHGGAILLVPHSLSDRDRDDIAAAAAPLLDLLAARGLLDGSST